MKSCIYNFCFLVFQILKFSVNLSQLVTLIVLTVFRWGKEQGRWGCCQCQSQFCLVFHSKFHSKSHSNSCLIQIVRIRFIETWKVSFIQKFFKRRGSGVLNQKLELITCIRDVQSVIIEFSFSPFVHCCVSAGEVDRWWWWWWWHSSVRGDIGSVQRESSSSSSSLFSLSSLLILLLLILLGIYIDTHISWIHGRTSVAWPASGEPQIGGPGQGRALITLWFLWWCSLLIMMSPCMFTFTSIFLTTVT